MRNLGLRSSASVAFSNAKVSAVAFDLDDNVIYVASDRSNVDVEVRIWRIDSDIKGLVEPPKPTHVALFTSTILPTFTPRASEVLSLRILPDSRSLCTILHGGDIVTIPLDNDNPIPDVVGSVDFGISAASWSPDDSLLALVTGDNKLMLMTSTFDVLTETSLHTADFGEDAPINVGWGSKQTQFHGSLGKITAQAPSTSLAHIGSSPDDDQAPRLSWRGDGAFFVVSSLSPESASGGSRRRTFRVYDREGGLQSTSEPVAGLEHVLSWRPSGNLIASTQRFGFEGGGAGKEGRHDVVFFERNGLRHGEFGLRLDAKKEGNSWGYKVREVTWSSDSNVLLVWVEHEDRDVVQLWTTSNYHWYLKQEITSPQPHRFTTVNWHPEIGLRLVLTTATEVTQRSYDWETWVSKSKLPLDTGSVAVLDGNNILLTPFRSQNVPPPMYSHQLPLSPIKSSPIHASFSDSADTLALLWENGAVQVWNLNTRLGPGRGKVMDSVKIWGGFINDLPSRTFRRVGISSSGDGKSSIVVLGSNSPGSDLVVIVGITDGNVSSKNEIELPGRDGNLVEDSPLTWQDSNGQLFNVDPATNTVVLDSKFPEYCSTSQNTGLSKGFPPFFVGLTQAGKLHVSGTSSRVLATNANSFTIASGYLVYTTMAHEANFVSVGALGQILDLEEANEGTVETEKRRVERGSRIIVAVPSNMTLVLQMPRGNLESINPRPMVLEVVRKDIDSVDYRKAFLACRKHRIDLDILVRHNLDAFFSQIPSLVEQIDDVDYINLFLTGVGRSSMSPEVICRVCDGVRMVLEKKDLTRYINSILTAYVLKTPPDYEASLSLLLRLRETTPEIVEDAVKYIIFLVDADSLFDLALGMYDFSLVLMIAQHAQKDPREYLPFLRELRAMEKYYQRFRIDDHLKRHEKALWNLSLAGPDRFDDAMEYVEKHRLYEPALTIWKGTEDYKSVLNVYGDWLFEHREFSQAALVFVEAAKPPKAMIAFEKALDWQELFELAMRDEMDAEDLSSMGYRVAEDLSSKKRYAEAARVFLDYAGDIRQAVIAFVEGNLFAEARRIATIHSLPELVTEIIHPGALESRSQISEEAGEMLAQLRKQVQRIQELRVRKLEEPDAFYGTEDIDLHNIDVMTDASMAPTAFTRYTVAPSTASKKSRQTSRSRRKAERKVGSGRKGTVDEEEYLLNSFAKLATRLATAQVEAGKLLPHMLQFTDEHREEGKWLQEEILRLQEELVRAIDEVWTKPEPQAENQDLSRPQDLIEKIPRPELAEPKWRVKLWEIKSSRSLL